MCVHSSTTLSAVWINLFAQVYVHAYVLLRAQVANSVHKSPVAETVVGDFKAHRSRPEIPSKYIH